MNKTRISLIAAAALSLSTAAASAQNLPPPGNVNPGSLNSGAEESGAPNQPRSRGYGWSYYNAAPYYVTPSYPGYTGAYNYVPRQGGAPIYGGGYYDQ